MADGQKPASRLKVWLVAFRAFGYSATALPVLVGTALAWEAGFPFRWGLALLTLLGMLCFNTAANLLNDVYDHRRGLDTQVNPGSGAIVRGWLTERQVHRAAWVSLVLGVAIGLLLVRFAGLTVLLLGIAGTILALAYTRSGFCLKYVGLGDVTIFAACGALPVFGSYWVQAQAFSWSPVLWSVAVGLPAVAILHANNWRDIASDPGRQCRTVASRIGARASRTYYRLLILAPFVLTAGYVVLARFDATVVRGPAASLAAFLALPLVLRLARRDWPSYPAEFAMLDARTAQTHLAFGILLAAGFTAAGLFARMG